MADEIIDICDENNEIIGTSMRSDAHKNGFWHRTSHVWIYNSKGEILLQHRSKEKKFFPNVWDISVAGHITTQEIPEEVAVRETFEEIGLMLQKEDLHFVEVRKKQYQDGDVIENVFHYVYLLKIDEQSEKFTLQTEEVQDIQFIPLETVEQELKIYPEKYAPRGDYWNDMLKIIKKKI